MPEQPPPAPGQTQRQRALTDEDLKALAALLANQHQCRFESITPDDLAFFKDMVVIYKEGRSEMIKMFVKALLYGTMMLVVLYAWIKYGGRN